MELNPDDERMTPRDVLARHLRRVREGAGLSLRGLEEKLRYEHSYFGRIENRTQLPSRALAKTIDDFFGTGELFTDLLRAEEDASNPGYHKAMLKEQRAVHIQDLTSTVVPGLLQTEEYARELMRSAHAWETEAQLEDWVAERMNRQRLFERAVPPHYWALLDETVLARPVGGPQCMARQLDHLLKVGESVYNTLLVVPFASGAHGNPGGSAILLTMPDGTTIGHVEGITTGETITARRRLNKLTRKFDLARSKSLSEEDSKDMILRYLKGYEDANQTPPGRLDHRRVAVVEP